MKTEERVPFELPWSLSCGRHGNKMASEVRTGDETGVRFPTPPSDRAGCYFRPCIHFILFKYLFFIYSFREVIIKILCRSSAMQEFEIRDYWQLFQAYF